MAEERVTDAEARFEALRHRVGFWAGPPVGFAIWLAGADGPDQRLAGIMAFTAIWWITEAIPVAATALLAAALTVVCGVASSKEAFAAFGNPLLFLFVGSFFIAEAMIVHRLGERMARFAYRIARGRFGVLVALSLTAFLLSLWMSNAAATAVILPVALAVAREDDDRGFGAALVLAIAFGASLGGLGTPVGTPPNLIGIGQLREAHVEIGFFRWMEIGVPLGLIMMVVMLAILAIRFGVRPGRVAKLRDTAARAWSQGEIAVTVSFAIAVLAWMIPGLVDLAAPKSDAAAFLRERLREEVVAILAASLLFVWPVGPGEDGEPRRALSWREATRIDWGTVILFGGGILLGDLAGKTGLAARMGGSLIELTGASSLWTLTALVTATSVLLSEATSNTATATLMVPLAISLARAAHVPLIPPALGATIGASFGFMLPISTAPNAMAFGTGRVTIREMAGAGIWFDVIGYVTILAGLRVLCPLLGLS